MTRPMSGPAGPSLVVEFAGAPGSGKSTLCQTVAESLRVRTGIPVDFVRMEKIVDLRSVARARGIGRAATAGRMTGHTLRAAVSEPAVVRHFLGVKRHREGFTSSDLVLQLQIHASRRAALRRARRRPGLHLCDSGLVTTFCQMRMYSVGEDIPPAVKDPMVPYLVVRLNVPEPELRERIMKRPHNPRARAVHSRHPDLLGRFIDALDRFEKDMGPSFSGSLSGVVDVENGEGAVLEENARLVEGVLEGHWSRLAGKGTGPGPSS